MKQRLYRLMDWPAIEAICYAEDDQPQEVLGAHMVGSATLYQTFLPDAARVDIVLEDEDRNIPMGMVDEEGFFAAVVSGKKKQPYHYVYTDEKGKSYVYKDPYQFDISLPEDDAKKLNEGIHDQAYEILGAHFCTVDDTEGVMFRVWAPNAVRVSVVGEFNNWDGRRNPMIRDKNTGVFMLFIPDLKDGMAYKYEILVKGNRKLLKNDPYGFQSKGLPNPASVMIKETGFDWNDDEWMKHREKVDVKHAPMSVYELNLNAFKDDEGNNKPLQVIAKEVIPFLKKMKYTHVELMPVMEYTDDYWNGYQTTGYYSIASRYGTCKEFRSFIDSLHVASIGVILDWVPSYFAKDEHGLCHFDGTYLYGHLDQRQRQNVAYDAYNYNYARPQVSNYLIANAIFWIKEYHADGLRISGLSSMLYMDYGKTNMQWVPNIYGGNENLEGIEFIKHFNSIVHKMFKGIVTIAKETSAWPDITMDVDQNGLGFDYVWNTGFTTQLISYMKKDKEDRIYSLGDLTSSLDYAFHENYILPISHNEIYRNGGSLKDCMQMDEKDKPAFLRLIYSYIMCYPGKKMFYMDHEADELLEGLQKLYFSRPAMTYDDNSRDGFEWIYNNENHDGVLGFFRKGEFYEDTLLVIVNVSDKPKHPYRMVIPFEGKYKPIFNSNQKEYGGTVTSRPKEAETVEGIDGRKYELTLQLLPMSVSVYSYRPFTKEELLKIAEKKVEQIRAQLEAEALEKAKRMKNQTAKKTVRNTVKAEESTGKSAK